MNANKLMKVLVKAPTMVDLNPNGRRAMFSIKDKKKLASYVTKYNLSASTIAPLYKHISPNMVRAWVRDYKAGNLKLGQAVAVRRG